jgi:Putative Ig domain
VPVAVLQGPRTGLNAPYGIAIGSSLYQTTTSLPGGHVGTRYSQTLGARLGVAPYHWSTFTGALPPGLHLSAKGVISGAPSAAEIGRFTVAVRDSAVPHATTVLRTLSIDVGVPLAVYVANSDFASNSIAAFFAPASGNVAPSITISGPHTGLSQPQAIAFDATARLYLANYGGSVTEYAPNASGDDAPSATIAGSLTGLYTPSAIAVDPHGNVFVANELGGTVTEYAPGAHGNVAPKATITGLSDPSALGFDPEGRFWVNSGDTLEAFPPAHREPRHRSRHSAGPTRA